jgi:hypothetical protein
VSHGVGSGTRRGPSRVDSRGIASLAHGRVAVEPAAAAFGNCLEPLQMGFGMYPSQLGRRGCSGFVPDQLVGRVKTSEVLKDRTQAFRRFGMARSRLVF